MSSLLERMELDRAILLTMKQIEARDPELAAVRATRNDKKYMVFKGFSFFVLIPLLSHD